MLPDTIIRGHVTGEASKRRPEEGTAEAVEGELLLLRPDEPEVYSPGSKGCRGHSERM